MHRSSVPEIQQVAAEHVPVKSPKETKQELMLCNLVVWIFFFSIVWESLTSYLHSVYIASYLPFPYPGVSFAKKMGHTFKTALNSCFSVSFHGCPATLIIHSNYCLR